MVRTHSLFEGKAEHEHQLLNGIVIEIHNET